MEAEAERDERGRSDQLPMKQNISISLRRGELSIPQIFSRYLFIIFKQQNRKVSYKTIDKKTHTYTIYRQTHKEVKVPFRLFYFFLFTNKMFCCAGD